MAGGETIDVKVEITPPIDTNYSTDIIVSMPSPVLPNSISFDSTTSTSMNLSLNLLEYSNPSPVVHKRKLSEISHENLLNPTNFGRFTPSPSSGTSSKLYKRIEELMDLSSPYNHYKCLSPSENNLTQVQENNKYTYSVSKIDKPGSSRLLRRQFSLDKEDSGGGVSLSSTSERHRSNSGCNQNNLDIPQCDLQELRTSPTNFKMGTRLPKQHSASLAIDLEKIEEIPLSPTSLLGNHHHHHRSCGGGDIINLPRIPGSESGSPSSRNGSIGSLFVEQQQSEFNINVETIVLR